MARLREANLGQDDERLRQEVVLFASRIDVDEELARLRTHLSELRRIVTTGGSVQCVVTDVLAKTPFGQLNPPAP